MENQKMSGILGLIGSGEFTEAMIEVDRFLLSQINRPKVAILPTAAGKEPYQKWIDGGENHFRNLGVEAVGIKVIDQTSANDPVLTNQLDDFNCYYFSGGDPGYLLDTLQDSLAWQVITRNFRKGAVLIGSSAGAMVFGKMVWGRIYDYINNSKLVPWETGLGVVDFGVLPHYDQINIEFTKDQLRQIIGLVPKDLKVIGIDEDTAYFRIGDDWQVMGKGQVHKL